MAGMSQEAKSNCAGHMPGADSLMTDLLLSPVGPALLLIAAGLLLRLVARIRRASLLFLLGLLPLLLSFLLLIRLRALNVQDLQLTWWSLVVPPLQVRWTLDGWNWLSLFLLLLAGTVAVLLTWRRPGLRTGAFHGLSLILMGAAALVVVSDNLLTLSGAWVATDILLVARLRGGRAAGTAVALGLTVAGSVLMLLAIGITSLGLATSSLLTAQLPAETLLLLLLASVLRMAVYPLHVGVSLSASGRDRGTRWLVAAVGLITGAWLLGRIYPLGVDIWLSQPAWPPLLALVLMGSAIYAWSSAEDEQLTALASNRAAWLVLILVLAAVPQGQDVLGYGLIASVLGLLSYVVGLTINQEWGWRLPLYLSAGILVGVPLLAGFPARVLAPPGNLLLGLLLIIAEGLVLSCILSALRQPSSSADLEAARRTIWPARSILQPSWPVVRLLAAFVLASVPALLWGLRPQTVANLAGFTTNMSLGQLVAATSLAQWLALVASLALAGGLARVTWLSDPTIHLWRQRLAYAFGLTWTVDAIQQGLTWIDSGLRAGLSIFEGEGYLGWLGLVILLAWLVIQLQP